MVGEVASITGLPKLNRQSWGFFMSQLSRRELARLGAGSVIAVAAVAASTTQASAYQGNMERALSALYEALAALREATPNKGGHKANAARLVEQAIEVRVGGEQHYALLLVAFAHERRSFICCALLGGEPGSGSCQ